MQPADYTIQDPSDLYTPHLVFYKDFIRHNIQRALEIAKTPERLRPHVKTHKTREIVQMEIEAGIRKHKCATIAEAEMLADAGVTDILIAYPMVGPNVKRLIQLMRKYPLTTFISLVDNDAVAEALSAAMTDAWLTHSVLLDLDVGQHRTGIEVGPAAAALYAKLARLPRIKVVGLHVYDGHNHQPAYADRQAAVDALLAPVLRLRADLEAQGLAVPKLVCGGTPTFPIFAALDLPGLECSPGTCVLDDANTSAAYEGLSGFIPAALVVTRVVSKPLTDRLTLDLGHKAIAADPPAGKRAKLLNLPDAVPLTQNEEHFVVQTALADQFPIGSLIYAIPTHICPTCALHRWAYVVENGQVIGRWEITARDRVLTV